jgi:micrococcal nuclease
MSVRYKWKWGIAVLVIILAVIAVTLAPSKESKEEKPIRADVINVTDGDTIIVRSDEYGESKVRLIGIDTPESVSPDPKKNVPFGAAAFTYTKETLLGKTVLLTFDIQEYDRYGRLLCYVYLTDGTLFNEELVRKGYARVYTVPPNVAHESEFLDAQKKAQEGGEGIWEDYESIFPEGKG